MSITSERLPVDRHPCPGNAGIRWRYPLDGAAWIWLDDVACPSASIWVDFTLSFTVETASEMEVVELDISADQRFILSCDDTEIGRGPDRAELGGWSFHRYRLSVPTGEHCLRARCWWLTPTDRPLAQVSARPGFALVGLGAWHQRLSTGVAPWRARQVTSFTTRAKAEGLGYHVIGSGFVCNGAAEAGAMQIPVVVQRCRDDRHGIVNNPWRLEPSPLPEQDRQLFSGGGIRVVQADHQPRIRMETGGGDLAGLADGQPVTIPAASTIQILWDFADYICAYPRLHLTGGAGSEVEISWAESLYDDRVGPHEPKGDRALAAGKVWHGFGDRILHPGGSYHYEMPWWRSGRWMRLSITTLDEPLTLCDARPLRTHHPFTRGWAFACDENFSPMLDLCERGLRNCVHETFVDCPYYEQMQYVGDTRIQALAWLAASGDARPVRRALELFDRSRWVNGFVAERVPTAELQMSATYSLVQPLILRDYALWVDDPATVRALLPGSRNALEQALACLDDDGLPSRLPGWLFVDWVHGDDWVRGVPGARRAANDPADPPLSASVALHLPLALEAMAEVEDLVGEPVLAGRYRGHASALIERILARYGDDARELIAEDAAHSLWSEHAQALALACQALPPTWRQRLVQGLSAPAEDLARASVYFSFHVHEALLQADAVEAYLDRLGFWRMLVNRGFLTPIEAPEPSRSDCHAWGAHPLYHSLTSLAGIRPSGLGFSRLELRPRFGPLQRLSATVPHPRGAVCVDLQRHGDQLRGSINSPVPGILHWNGNQMPIPAGLSVLP